MKLSRRNPLSRLPLLLLAGALAAPALFNSALAATPINETRPLEARGHLSVDNLKGSIEVRAVRDMDAERIRVGA